MYDTDTRKVIIEGVPLVVEYEYYTWRHDDPGYVTPLELDLNIVSVRTEGDDTEIYDLLAPMILHSIEAEIRETFTDNL